MKRSMVLALSVLLAIGLFAVPGVAAAVPAVTLSVSDQSVFDCGNLTWYVSGRVNNSSGGAVTDAIVHLVFYNTSSVAIGSVDIPVSAHVIPNSGSAPFCWTFTRLAGHDTTGITATGVPTSSAVHQTAISPMPTRTDVTYGRLYPGTFTNTNGQTIGGVIVNGWEWWSSAFYCSVSDTLPVRNVVAAGATQTYSAMAWRATLPGLSITSSYYEWEPYTPASVWRFYNVRTGTHFYTADPAERDRVINTLGATYHLDGVGYTLNTSAASNYRPLYRFYNRRTGTHFYTADTAERDNVINTLGATYQYDGPSYNVSGYPWFGLPVYRFYNRRTGTHFYTADPGERDNVINTLSSIYTYEGPSYYLSF